MNIILCGMPGCGKTYYGKQAAEYLGRCFIDTDDKIVAEYFKTKGAKATCREIALMHGEKYFRQLESLVIHQLADVRESIIAVGGGALDKGANVDALKRFGCLVYLKAPYQLLLKRLLQKPVLPSYVDPNHIEASLMALMERRLPVFKRYCDKSVDTEGGDVSELIRAYLGKGEIEHGE